MTKADTLEIVFADKIRNSRKFRLWVLSRTKFDKYGSRVKLLHKEQTRERVREPPVKHWAKWWFISDTGAKWEHWCEWCRARGVTPTRAVETDILLAFQRVDTKECFAIHIENKTLKDSFKPGQAEAYKHRAEYMLTNPPSGGLNCTDFATMIIAPLQFRNLNKAKCDLFDSYISHEEIANFIPAFGT